MRFRESFSSRCLFVASFFFVFSLPLPLYASAESEALTSEGVAHLKAGRYKQAIESFNAAVKADAKDLRAVFFQGVALNRLGSHRQALVLLTRVEALGLRHPEMDFEVGWSHMGVRQPKSCVERLMRFEKATPGRGQTSEFLGRCHLMLGALDQAEASFRRAVERDPRLKSSVDLQMAAVEQARGRPDAMKERLDAAAKADTLTGRALREVMGIAPPPSAALVAKPLRIGVSFSVGYNDNVIGLGSTIPLPADITRRGSMFARASANIAYTHAFNPQTAGTLGYSILADRYDEISQADLNDLFFYGDVFHKVNDRLGLSFRVSDEYTGLGRSRFRNLLTFRPALTYRFTERSVTEFAFAHGKNDYFARLPIIFSRDGDTNAATVTHLFQVAQTQWSGALSGSYTTNRTEGSDFSFDAYAFSASARYDFTRSLAGVIGLGYTRYDYTNPNSLAAFAFARDDDQQVLFVQIVGSISEQWRWFLQGQKLRNKSNIAFFDFKQGTFSAGVAADF